MKKRDLVKYLSSLGAEFKEGSKHTRVYLNGKSTTIPRTVEVDKFTTKAIIKQLGIES